jgi:hypothetical protein
MTKARNPKGALMGSANVERSGTEWLLTLRDYKSRAMFTVAYATKTQAKHAADVLMSSQWLVIA